MPKPLDTDRLTLSKRIIDELEAEVILVDGVRHFPRAYVYVPARRRTEKVAVSAARVFWAIAHPTSHLTDDDVVAHRCACHKDRPSDDPAAPVCIDLDHMEAMPYADERRIIQRKSVASRRARSTY